MAEPPTQPKTLEPTDAILTVPNLLTFLRFGLVIPFFWFALAEERLDIAISIAVFGVVTDLVDGVIARRYGQVSKLGIALDPLADRLGVAAAGVVLIVHEALVPLWLVVVVLGRDASLVLVGIPVLRARKIPLPPVSRVGKFGSFWTSIAMAMFLAAGWNNPAEPIRGVQIAAWIISAVGIPAYYAAGIGYARAAFGGTPTRA